LLGRIVFLYFVQKKGWLGASNTKYTDGQSDFIKQLFKQSGAEDTFYCSWLKTLFFDTLNKERANDDFEMPDGRRVKVPFLNGGLFDKEEFDEQFLILEAKLFYNPDFEDVILTAKNNGSARGFLDFLDAFNFTVYEDSPDEQTVAVDPEMLGHIFENLLEDNKDKGAYYTPKEIVHYMCQESLIEYLCTTLKIEDDTKEKEAIVALLQHKELYPILMPKISDVDEALDRVKICDPAIGSGAFPMGLLQEIFSMKELIAYETDKEWNPAETKLNIIQNSIYGVDIEKGAVDIARLRFWLSLVVDEEKPKPLPNLDYKIVVGDSLISKFDGEIVEIDWERKSSVGKADDYVKNVQRLLGEIANKQKNYFNPNNKNKKKLQAEIRNLKIELLINQLSYNKLAYVENTPQKGGFMPTAADIKHNTERELHIAGFKNLIDKLKYLSKRHDEPFNYFDWKLDFPEVLNPYLVNGNGGFDIVIGNPPYVRQERIGSEYKELLKNRFPSVANGIADMYVYFFGIGLELLKVKGVLSYITLNKYLKTKYGRELRNLLATRYDVDIIIDFFELPVFEASTDACITKIIATKGEIETKYFPVKTLDNLNLFELISGNFQKVVKDETEWKFMDSNQESILEKIYANTINLEKFTNNQIYSGIKTAFNRAFILEDDIAEKLLNSESKSLVKPYAQSKDIKQWHLENTNKYFLATGYSIDVKKEFPTAYNYLHQFEQELKQRQDKGINWWNLRACKYYNNFEKPKIIYMHTAKKHEFYFDTEGRYINNSCYMIISDSQFLFCFLNSKLFEWFKKIKFVAYGDAEESGRAKLDYNKMITVPIKNVSKSIEKTFTNLVQNIKTNKSEGKNTIALEQQIDNLIYCLYELSYDEVKEIDPDFPLTKEEYERIVIE